MKQSNSINFLEFANKDNMQALQTSFDVYDDCKSKSKNTLFRIIYVNLCILPPVENADDCLTAHEIYACGIQNDPATVHGMIDQVRLNVTVVTIMRGRCEDFFLNNILRDNRNRILKCAPFSNHARYHFRVMQMQVSSF